MEAHVTSPCRARPRHEARTQYCMRSVLPRAPGQAHGPAFYRRYASVLWHTKPCTPVRTVGTAAAPAAAGGHPRFTVEITTHGPCGPSLISKLVAWDILIPSKHCMPCHAEDGKCRAGMQRAIHCMRPGTAQVRACVGCGGVAKQPYRATASSPHAASHARRRPDPTSCMRRRA